MRLYYLRHGFHKSDVYMAYFLDHFAFIALERLKKLRRLNSASSPEELKEAQSTVILAAKGLYDQGTHWYLPYTIFHMVCKGMCPDELQIIHTYTGVEKSDLSTDKLRVHHVRCQYPIRAFDRTDDPEQLRLEDLVHRYADMAVEENRDATEDGSSL